jgi:AraC family cel operon transcriptional repressor
LVNIILHQYLQLSSHPQWITSLLSVLNNPVNLSWSLESLTKDVNFTQSYMCRDFKKHVGMTMTEYFNNQKMYYAHALLTTTANSIERICEMIGINNVSHFYKLYKKVYGTTPKKARRFYASNYLKKTGEANKHP